MERRIAIGGAELEVLKYVLDHAPVAGRLVADHFADHAALARTTILTVLDRLRDKGFLRRDKVAGVYLYAAMMSKAELMRTLVGEFVDKTLGGSVSPFFAYLLEEAKISDWELAELKRVVRTLDHQREPE